MAMQSSETHPALSRTDGIASASGDVLVLVGRILLGGCSWRAAGASS
ncbi:MAG TPA: hypothetical protein VIH40_02515 [Xanthobacteraceae bacterium]